jgi:hypothetical protein
MSYEIDVWWKRNDIRASTRSEDWKSALIDVILSNHPELFSDSGVYNPEISDHAAVYVFCG